MAQNRAKMLLLQGVYSYTAWTDSIFVAQNRAKSYYSSAKPCIFFKQPQCLAPAGQSWAEAGSGVNWSSPASSAGTGAGPRGSGPRRRGAACCWTAPAAGLRGGAAACGAAGRAAA